MPGKKPLGPLKEHKAFPNLAPLPKRIIEMMSARRDIVNIERLRFKSVGIGFLKGAVRALQNRGFNIELITTPRGKFIVRFIPVPGFEPSRFVNPSVKQGQILRYARETHGHVVDFRKCVELYTGDRNIASYVLVSILEKGFPINLTNVPPHMTRLNELAMRARSLVEASPLESVKKRKPFPKPPAKKPKPKPVPDPTPKPDSVPKPVPKERPRVAPSESPQRTRERTLIESSIKKEMRGLNPDERLVREHAIITGILRELNTKEITGAERRLEAIERMVAERYRHEEF